MHEFGFPGLFKTILYSLCSPPLPDGLEHTKLKELTVFDNWECWGHLQRLPHNRGLELCRQITRLRVHDPLSMDFTKELFPSLTHYSCTARPNLSVGGQLREVCALPKLEDVVITSYFWKNEPADEKTLKLLEKDKRIRLLYFGPGKAGEFELWCGRSKQFDCIWTKRAELRRLS
ncbi:hypothetical protein BDZ97DRAFT_300558 [Flammula alnicola]|nr:hypothetical protein BDZ97DRAFT_300558 [Flammula alnicola]